MYKFLLLLSLALLVISCGKPTINGKVIDNFNEPVAKVNVSIEGTSLTTPTNSKGEYSIEFVAGNDIKLNFDREGYLASKLIVNISVEKDFPAENVQTYRIPDGQGIYYQDAKNYIEICKKKIFRESNNFRGVNKLGAPTEFLRKTYFVKIDENEIPIIKTGSLLFVDNNSANESLLVLNKIENNKYEIASMTYPLRWYYDLGRRWMEYSPETIGFIKNTNLYCRYFEMTVENLENRNKNNIFFLRKIELKSGFYGFCTISNSGTNLVTSDYIHIFKVE